ncbi:hypothetical protein ADL22_13055 [Streptomyces sp. NRRL F-4489]|uniref:hypothetical protein n=1 Tax=Streptomyces sp. NRRL F-4489 TaxID=1609095 RepID=UPI00074B286A|nr:hypothetical protein [Streptomyces sp. NRRL F-4489]KUL43812.1 hypothetical protein ADL22_13055 [Streptomyces sp. NRRL F-4489]
MHNHDLTHAAVPALSWHPERDLGRHGPHALRRAHLRTGALGARLHLAAEAAGLGSGLLLGVDLRALDRALSGDEAGGPGPRTGLAVALGPRLPGRAALRARLLP